MVAVKRMPIITRIPIISTGSIFQTIASRSNDFSKSIVLGVYPTLESARSHYKEDMDNNKGQGYKQYAIRQLNQEDN